MSFTGSCYRIRAESSSSCLQVFYSERTSTAGSPHLVDVLGALDGELCQSGDVKLSAAVRVHLDVQLVGGILPQQVPEGQQRHLQPAGSDSGLNNPQTTSSSPKH